MNPDSNQPPSGARAHLRKLHALNAPTPLSERMRGGLVVSCQPVDGSAMDRDDIVVAMAHAAVAGGAVAVRIEGATRVAAVVRGLDNVPVIGLIKRDLVDSPVRITPLLEDVAALAAAGADIIAVDATARTRPASASALRDAIRASGALAMADCSNVDDALAAAALGFDIVGTTLSGYTGGETPSAPDIPLVRTLAAALPPHVRLMAEGRFNTPADARAAIEAGAWAVTVGSAITRIEVVTGWFADSLRSLYIK
ncbi:MAG: N-acetylmannosamine-6-phosphate 2-epimerase [Burkholderiales bacterium]